MKKVHSSDVNALSLLGLLRLWMSVNVAPQLNKYQCLVFPVLQAKWCSKLKSRSEQAAQKPVVSRSFATEDRNVMTLWPFGFFNQPVNYYICPNQKVCTFILGVKSQCFSGFYKSLFDSLTMLMHHYLNTTNKLAHNKSATVSQYC